MLLEPLVDVATMHPLPYSCSTLAVATPKTPKNGHLQGVQNVEHKPTQQGSTKRTATVIVCSVRWVTLHPEDAHFFVPTSTCVPSYAGGIFVHLHLPLAVARRQMPVRRNGVLPSALRQLKPDTVFFTRSSHTNARSDASASPPLSAARRRSFRRDKQLHFVDHVARWSEKQPTRSRHDEQFRARMAQCSTTRRELLQRKHRPHGWRKTMTHSDEVTNGSQKPGPRECWDPTQKNLLSLYALLSGQGGLFVLCNENSAQSRVTCTRNKTNKRML